MPLKIHLLNKRFLSYVTPNRDLNIYLHLDLKMDLAQDKVGANILPVEQNTEKGPRQEKDHLFENTLLSMLYLATGICQALSQMAGSDSSHPQHRYSTVQHKISDILSHQSHANYHSQFQGKPCVAMVNLKESVHQQTGNKDQTPYYMTACCL